MKAKTKTATENCGDKACPIHGSIKTRGKTFSGPVIKASMQKTITIEFTRQFPVPKYERFEERKTRIKAHLPPCMTAPVGTQVKIMETRPISKTKTFVVIEIIK